MNKKGHDAEVTRTVWIYGYVHAMSVWVMALMTTVAGSPSGQNASRKTKC